MEELTKEQVEQFFLGVERAAAYINYSNFCRTLNYAENEDMWNRWLKFCGALHELDGEDVAKLITEANRLSAADVKVWSPDPT